MARVARSLPALTVRRSADGDSARLRRLAQLDGAAPANGPHLLAEADGELLAAVPLAGGRAIADPFRPTADVIALLELRAAQLRSRPAAPRRRRSRVLAALAEARL